MSANKGIEDNAELFIFLLNKLTVFCKDKIQYNMKEVTSYTGLSTERFSVIYNISLKEGQTLKKLASKLKTSSSSLSIMIKHLIEDDLVIREKNPEDRREISLKLSKKGEKLLYKAQKIFAERINIWLNNLSTTEKNKLNTAINNLLKILKREIKDNNADKKRELAYDFLDLINILTLMAREEFEKGFGKFSERMGLSHKRVFVLYIISINPGINLKELSIRTKTSSSSLSLMIDSLVENGLVKRNEDSKDRRKIELNLTSKGEKISKKTMKHYIKNIKKWIEDIPKSKRTILREASENIVQIITDSISCGR